MEQPHRFHPEDTEAWHGGVTAFPGSGGKVIGLRNKRLLRQFEPKKEWYDYEDQVKQYHEFYMVFRILITPDLTRTCHGIQKLSSEWTDIPISVTIFEQRHSFGLQASIFAVQ